MSLSNILKSDVLNWFLLKSGLKVPVVNQMTNDYALQEGLSLINEDLLVKQEQIFQQLKTAGKEEAKQPEDNGPKKLTKTKSLEVPKSELAAAKR